MGIDTHLITSYHTIPLLLRTARAHESFGLLVEVTDGTAELNANTANVSASDYCRHIVERETGPCGGSPAQDVREARDASGR